jgi:hypothetical protein
MGILKRTKRKLGLTAADRLVSKESELALYEFAARQIESGERDLGIWAKAIADAGGSQKKAKGEYLRLMVEKLRAEIDAGVGLAGPFEIFQQQYEAFLKQNKVKIKQQKKLLIQKKDAEASYNNAQGSRKFWFYVMFIFPPGFLFWIRAILKCGRLSGKIEKADTELQVLDKELSAKVTF